MSSRKSPSSIIFPFSITRILSTYFIAPSLCVIIISVFPFELSSKKSYISFSFIGSIADVGSSSVINSEVLLNPLRIAILCYSPPESSTPPNSRPKMLSKSSPFFFTNLLTSLSLKIKSLSNEIFSLSDISYLLKNWLTWLLLS